jgi:hypothetical protein
MKEDTKAKVMGKFNEIKSNIETFISDVNVNELKQSLNTMIKDAQKDFSKLVDRDVESMKKKLQKEKADIESKAKKFLDGHKKEVAMLQAKIDKLMKATAKLRKTKVGAPKAMTPTSKKKVLKKAAKATAKNPGFKPKTTKKTTRKIPS